MKNKWKSFFYVPIMAAILFFSGTYIGNRAIYDEHYEPNRIYHLDDYFHYEETLPEETYVADENSIILEKPSNAEFLIKLEDNLVVVYRMIDLEHSYMVTGISSFDLPKETIEELEIGKEIINEEELYFFLESHSS